MRSPNVKRGYDMRRGQADGQECHHSLPVDTMNPGRSSVVRPRWKSSVKPHNLPCPERDALF